MILAHHLENHVEKQACRTSEQNKELGDKFTYLQSIDI
jgi:hypothetical protein